MRTWLVCPLRHEQGQGGSLAFTHLETPPQTWQESDSYICSSGGCLVGDLDFRQQFWWLGHFSVSPKKWGEVGKLC